MAVPDWPGTYGYNLFLYPWTAWLYGPFDLLVEHGHRLLASLVGLVAIGLCVVAYRNERRSWLRSVCYWLLAGIISQGVLGGIRVLLDARTVAMLHGCLGPLVFALASFIVMASSRDWNQASKSIAGKGLLRVSFVLLFLSIVQLFVGAQLRHAQPTWSPSTFTSMVHTHLLLATVISIFVLAVSWLVRMRAYRSVDGLRIPANSLFVVLLAQVTLGLATWIANYATPWIEMTPWLARYTLQGKGFWESLIVTGHQATGSLLIVASLWMVCRVIVRSRSSVSSITLASHESLTVNPSNLHTVGSNS